MTTARVQQFLELKERLTLAIKYFSTDEFKKKKKNIHDDLEKIMGFGTFLSTFGSNNQIFTDEILKTLLKLEENIKNVFKNKNAPEYYDTVIQLEKIKQEKEKLQEVKDEKKIEPKKEIDDEQLSIMFQLLKNKCFDSMKNTNMPDKNFPYVCLGIAEEQRAAITSKDITQEVRHMEELKSRSSENKKIKAKEAELTQSIVSAATILSNPSFKKKWDDYYAGERILDFLQQNQADPYKLLAIGQQSLQHLDLRSREKTIDNCYEKIRFKLASSPSNTEKELVLLQYARDVLKNPALSKKWDENYAIAEVKPPGGPAVIRKN